jgi:hypothetical protein
MKYHNRIIYKEGDILGKCVFISEEESYVSKNGRRRRIGRFQCHCGTEFKCRIESVTTENRTSCGCSRLGHGMSNATHGATLKKTRTTEFIIWQGMINRCKRDNVVNRNSYFLKGVTVCERWKGREGFGYFLGDMGSRPSKRHSLDRIDNDGNYEPSNCRWATVEEQNRNKSTNVFITFRGNTKCMVDWAKELGIHAASLKYRILKWGVEKALTAPVKKIIDNNEL